MPLVTRISEADGTLHKLPHGWGWWHVECMVKVIRAEQDVDPAEGFLDVLSRCPYTTYDTHTFTDPEDGEVLDITPGMVLDAWRE